MRAGIGVRPAPQGSAATPPPPPLAPCQCGGGAAVGIDCPLAVGSLSGGAAREGGGGSVQPGGRWRTAAARGSEGRARRHRLQGRAAVPADLSAVDAARFRRVGYTVRVGRSGEPESGVENLRCHRRSSPTIPPRRRRPAPPQQRRRARRQQLSG